MCLLAIHMSSLEKMFRFSTYFLIGLFGFFILTCMSSSCMALEQPWGDTPRPRSEKPQLDDRHWSGGCMVLEWLWGDTHVQGQRRSPRKTVWRANSCLETNPIPVRDTQRAQTNLVPTRTQGPHREWDRTVFGSLLWRYGSSVDGHRERGSGWSRLGYGIPLGGGRH